MTTVRNTGSTVSASRTSASSAAQPSSSGAARDPKPGQSYQVRSGDTLSAIAKKAYGDASRWRDIAEANPGRVGPDGAIRAGETIQIPASGADRLQTGSGSAAARQMAAQRVSGQPGAAGQAADPALQQDLARQMAAARLGAPGGAAEGGPSTLGRAVATASEKTRMKSTGYEAKTSSNARAMSLKGESTKRISDSWAKDREDATDEAQKQKKISREVNVTATLAHTGTKGADEAWAAGNMRGEGRDLLGGAVKGHAGVHALGYDYKATADVGVDVLKKSVVAGAAWKSEAHLVAAQAKATSSYGNQVAHGETTVHGKAFVGAELNGEAKVSLSTKGVTAKGGIDAFAGAKAGVTVTQTVGVAGHDVGSVTGKGEVYAGVGIKAKGEASYERGHLKLSGELGAALGIGAGVKVSIDVDVVGSAKAVVAGATAAGQAIADGASYAAKKAGEAYDAAASAASSAYDSAVSGAKSAFDAVSSYFW